MTLASLAEQGWIGLVLLIAFFLRQQIKMLAMRLVFAVYQTSSKDQNKWLMQQARRNDKVTLARGFWNRASQKTPTTRPRRVAAHRRGETAAVAELSAEMREPRSPAA